jgi:hypothetical protein
VILVATALGSGEYVIWPFISSKLGLVVLWAAVVAVGIQFFINMEFERYTLATGETAITGFTRLWKSWWFLFVLMAIIPNVWPGFATGGRHLPLFRGRRPGREAGRDPRADRGGDRADSVADRLPDGRAVPERDHRGRPRLAGLRHPARHQGQRLGDAVTGFSHFGSIPTSPDVTAAVIAGAIAFAGSCGCGNLAVSNWIRDKGFGMGHYIPRIVSPMTGEQEAVPATGNTFPTDEKNMRRWRGLVEGGKPGAGRHLLVQGRFHHALLLAARQALSRRQRVVDRRPLSKPGRGASLDG